MAKKSKRLQVDVLPDKMKRIDEIRQTFQQQARRVPSRVEVVDRALEFGLSQEYWKMMGSYTRAALVKA